MTNLKSSNDGASKVPYSRSRSRYGKRKRSKSGSGESDFGDRKHFGVTDPSTEKRDYIVMDQTAKHASLACASLHMLNPPS